MHFIPLRSISLHFQLLRSRLFYLRCFMLRPRTAPDHPPLKTVEFVEQREQYQTCLSIAES
jgi:hypothetical protein